MVTPPARRMEMFSSTPPPAPSAPPPYPPYPPYSWPTPPPQKSDSKLAIIIIVVVLLIIIVPIVLAAVLYVMVSGLVEGPGPGEVRPAVTFGQASSIADGFEFTVAGATLSRPASSYRVNLLVNGTASASGPAVLAPTVTFAVEGQTYVVTWSDVGGEGDLTGGDLIRVTRTGGISPHSVFTVVFLWTDGTTVAIRNYQGSDATKPQITFGQGHPVTDGFEFEVGGATLQRPAASYRVNLLVNGSASTTGAKTLSTSMTFTSAEVPARTYTITWADIGGEGDLTGGDRIKLTRTPGGIHALADFTVIFLWTDGSSVGSRTYP